MSDPDHVLQHNLNVRVGSFHRAYNLRPIGGWLSNTYNIQVKCRKCATKQEYDLSNHKIVMGSNLYNILLECPDCYSFPCGNVTIISNFNGPQSINEDGVSVTVMKVNLEGLCFDLVPEVGLSTIKWSCNVEKRNEPNDTVVRKFYLENGGFYESSHWDDSEDERSDGTDSDSSSDGWDSDDSDRPYIKNVTATLEPADWV